jgi:hypothetical protein
MSPAVAVGSARGDDVCVTHDNIHGPLSPPPDELLNRLRRMADHDDAPDTVQAAARDYPRYLEAALSGSCRLTGEARLTMAATAAAQHAREVVGRVPRPRCGTT